MLYLIDFEIKAKAAIIKRTDPDIHFTFATQIHRIFKKLLPSDIVFAFNYKDSQGFEKLYSEGIKTYPSQQLTQLCLDRIVNVEFIDSVSKFPMQREIIKDAWRKLYLKDGFVYKVGNDHQGQSKYRKGDKEFINLYNENVVIEEFIEGRSLRVLWIGDSPIVIEHINDYWIKNVNPSQEIVHKGVSEFAEIIEDSRNILKNINGQSPTIGFDYVVGDKIGLLEINHVCGLPDNQMVIDMFADEVLRLATMKS
jgi:hypothetical protein